jgi:hypothetical protein
VRWCVHCAGYEEQPITMHSFDTVWGIRSCGQEPSCRACLQNPIRDSRNQVRLDYRCTTNSGIAAPKSQYQQGWRVAEGLCNCGGVCMNVRSRTCVVCSEKCRAVASFSKRFMVAIVLHFLVSLCMTIPRAATRCPSSAVIAVHRQFLISGPCMLVDISN